MSDADRISEAIRAIIREEFPRITFLGAYAYSVQDSGGLGASLTITADPVDTNIPLPSIEKAPSFAYVNALYTPTPGTLCTVMFHNGDPARPMVINFQDTFT